MSEFNGINQYGIVRANILKSFGSEDTIEKGKKGAIGEVREWRGKKYKKVKEGKWVPVGDEKAKVGQDFQPYAKARSEMSVDELKGAIQQVIQNTKSKKGTIIKLHQLGLNNDEIVSVSGLKISDVKWYAKENFTRELEDAPSGEKKTNPNLNYQYTKPIKDDDSDEVKATDNINSIMADDYESLPEIDVNDRWQSYEMMGRAICMGFGKSAIAYGTGGVGKTFTLMGKGMVFDQHNMKEFDEDFHDTSIAQAGFEPESDGLEEDENRMDVGPKLLKDQYDYMKVTGKVSAAEMYKTLFEHNGKTIIFDDCDSVLKDENAVNVLKGALDTSGDGTIEWKTRVKVTTMYSNVGGRAVETKKGTEYHVPKRFKFTGQVLFISNLAHSQMPQALLSRAYNVDLTMNADETVKRIKSFYDKIGFQDPQGNPIEVSKETRDDVMNFLDKYKNSLDPADLNVRTFIKVALLKKTIEDTGSDADWKKIASSMLKK